MQENNKQVLAMYKINNGINANKTNILYAQWIIVSVAVSESKMLNWNISQLTFQ